MLSAYKESKERLAELNGKSKELYSTLRDVENGVTSLERKIEADKKAVESNIEKEVKEELERAIEEQKKKNKYLSLELEEFKKTSFNRLMFLSEQIKNRKMIDEDEYLISFKKLQDKCENLKEIISRYLDKETLQLYSKLSYSVNLTNYEIEDLVSWLVKFEKNFTDYETILISLSKKEEIIKTKFEGFYLITFILIGLGALKSMGTMFAFPYLICIGSLLYIRIKRYYFILKLLAIFNIYESLRVRSNRSYSDKINDYIVKQENIVNQLKLDSKMRIENLAELIKNKDKEDEEKMRKEFDTEKARERARKSLEIEDKNSEEMLKADKERIESIKEDIKELEEKLIEERNTLKDIKEKIKKSYEELESDFSQKELVTEFFMGFDNNEEPIRFDYDGEPTLITYIGSNEAMHSAVLSTIKMMCAQIMCVMNPLCYQINVCDNRTGGTDLAQFQVSSNQEDKASSDLFNIMGTTNKQNALINELYKEFNARRVKIIGNYEDIRKMNKVKEESSANTEKFIINILYQYDYNTLANNEELRQLCRVCKQVGIVLIFFLDITKFEKKPNKDEKISAKEHKDYTFDNLLKIIDIFREENMFTYKYQNDVIDISSIRKEELKVLNKNL